MSSVEAQEPVRADVAMLLACAEQMLWADPKAALHVLKLVFRLAPEHPRALKLQDRCEMMIYMRGSGSCEA